MSMYDLKDCVVFCDNNLGMVYSSNYFKILEVL